MNGSLYADDLDRLILIRDVSQEECPWLQRNYNKGEMVCIGTGFHYGCISPNGIGCAELTDPGGCLFEIPKDALNIKQSLYERYKRSTLNSEVNVNDIPFVVVYQEILSKDFPSALKDFKKGDRLFFYPDFDKRNTPDDCIPVTEKVGSKIYFELPNHLIRTIYG